MELIERIYWLIRLRWIAVIGVILTVIFAVNIFGFSLPIFSLCGIAVWLGAYNLIFFIWTKNVETRLIASLPINKIANAQISLDLLSLAALIHFSGGVENPFIFYFIFHMIIASILLSRRASYLQATLATFLFMSVAGFEYSGFLGHYCLKGFTAPGLHTNKTYIAGVSFVFTTTLYIAVYMASSISVKLREREKSLKEANLLLEEKDRIKSEYVLRVSHDIKEHLSAIQSCVEPVAEGITGELKPQQKDLIQRARERTDKLLSFVRALLEITRIKLSRQIEMNRFPLKKTIESAVSFVESKAKDKGILIGFDIDDKIDTIWGAEIYIEETIANLLANSVKYTAENGRIDVSARDDGDSVLIQIADTGIGIPEDEIPRIFEEFYRARNAKDVERTGTGLGLAIAKQVVERHKGRIWVESKLGKGSTFNIMLPKQASLVPSPSPQASNVLAARDEGLGTNLLRKFGG